MVDCLGSFDWDWVWEGLNCVATLIGGQVATNTSPRTCSTTASPLRASSTGVGLVRRIISEFQMPVISRFRERSTCVCVWVCLFVLCVVLMVVCCVGFCGEWGDVCVYVYV